MVQQVKAEDGTLHEFPDEATPDQMMAAISSSKPAAPAEKPGIMARIKEGVLGVPATALGDIETGYRMAQGAVQAIPAGLAGIAQGAYNVGAEALGGKPGMPADKRIEQVQSYGAQPLTQVAKQNMQTIGGFVQPMVEAARSPGTRLAEAGYPTLGTIVGAAPEAAMIMLAPEARGAIGAVARGGGRAAAGAVARIPGVTQVAERIASSGEAKAAAENLERLPENTRIERLKRGGYFQTPTKGGGGFRGRAAEGFAGQLQTEYAVSRRNSVVHNRTAAKDIGLAEGQPLTDEAIEAQKQKAGAIYDQVRNTSKETGRVKFEDQFTADMEKVRERTETEALDFPDDVNDAIEKEIGKFSRADADSSSILSKVKKLRERASANMRGDADKFELGIAQKKIATAMEDQLERHLEQTNPTLIQQFRDARKQFAKIYSVEDALTPNGNISPAVLARQLKRGVPLDGGLKDIAEAYLMDKRAHRTVDDLGGKGEFSRIDMLVGGAEMIAHPGKAGIIIGGMLGRPLARAAITSKRYQAKNIKPTLAQPSLASRAARKITEAGKKGQTLESLPPSATESGQ